MSSWTWVDPVPKKTVPMRAITLKLRPELLHQFDIRDLRSPSEKRAMPGIEEKEEPVPARGVRRVKKPRTRKKPAIVVAEDIAQDQVEIGQASDLPAPVKPVQQPQPASQVQPEGEYEQQAKPPLNIFDLLIADSFEPLPEIGTEIDSTNNVTEMDLGMNTEAPMSAVANGAPDDNPFDGDMSVVEEADDNNKENVPPAVPMYAPQPSRPVVPNRLDTDMNAGSQTFTGFGEGPSNVTQYTNMFGQGGYVSQDYHFPSYQFVGRQPTGLHPGFAFAGTNGWGSEHNFANGIGAGQYMSNFNTFAPGSYPPGVNQSGFFNQFQGLGVDVGFPSQSVGMVGSGVQPIVDVGARNHFMTGATQQLHQFDQYSTFIPPRPQSVTQINSAASTFAEPVGAVNTHIPQPDFYFPTGLTPPPQDQLPTNMSQFWGWYEQPLQQTSYQTSFSNGTMSGTGAVNFDLEDVVNPTGLTCADCGGQNVMATREPVTDGIGELTNNDGNDANTAAVSPVADPILAVETDSELEVDRIDADELIGENGMEAPICEIATAPSPFDENVERARLRELDRDRPRGNTPELTAEELQWKEIVLDMRGVAYRRSRDNETRHRYFHGMAYHGHWLGSNLTSIRGPYVATPHDEDVVDPASKTFKEVELWQCEGLTVNVKGTVLDREGALVAYLVSGDTKRCAGQEINERGQVLDIAGTVIGKIKVSKPTSAGEYELLDAGSKGLYDCHVDRIVVRKLPNLGVRREGFWDFPYRTFNVGGGSGEHWKNVDGWKEVLRTGLDEKAIDDLGLHKVEDKELSERKIIGLLAVELAARGVIEEESPVDTDSSEDLDEEVDIGNDQDAGPHGEEPSSDTGLDSD